MPAQQNANTVALQLEKVRDKVPLLYERDDMLFTMIQAKTDVEKVSSRLMRLPLQMSPGGKAGGYNPDGGDLGLGGGTDYEVATVTPQFFKFAVQTTKLVEYATNSPEKAVENATKKLVSDSMAQFRTFLDQISNTAGNAVIATVSSITGNVITASVPFGAALVAENQTVQVYDATVTTYRGSANVVAYDPGPNQTITLDSAPAGTIATDVLIYDVIPGGSGANPIGLFGIQYHQSAATTGTWLNLNRATFAPKLTTPNVSGGSSALTPQMVRLALNLQKKALGIKTQGKPKFFAYMALEQSNAWENLGILISSIIKEGAGGRANDLDLLFTGNMSMSGVPIKESIHADQTRIDFLDLSHWGRAVMKDIGFFKNGEGQTMFQVYGASGGLAASYLFYYDTGFQIWDDSPRSGAFINLLSRPSGY